MKFICPNCKQETEIEVVMTGCVVSETITFDSNGEAEYGYPEIHDSTNDRYQCRECGWRLPVDPNAVDDDALQEWLQQQQYQTAKVDYAEELFRMIRETGHTAVKFCNWTLDLREMRSIPPCSLPGFCPTTYTDADPMRDSDLRTICRDFTRSALAFACQVEPIDKTIHTTPNPDELEN